MNCRRRDAEIPLICILHNSRNEAIGQRVLISTRSRLAAVCVAARKPRELTGDTVAPEPEFDYFVYPRGFLSDGVAGFQANDIGEPRPIEGTARSGRWSWPMRVTPDGEFLVVASIRPKRMYAYRIHGDGRLTSSSPVRSIPRGPVDLTFAPDSRHGYITLGFLRKAAVQNFTLDADGIIHLVGSPVMLGERKDSFSTARVSPDGKNLYLGSYFRRELLRLPIGPDGTVDHVAQRIATGKAPLNPTPTPDGRFVYISNELSHSVSGYRVAEDGSLGELPGSPFPSGRLPHVIAITPDSRHVYVPNLGSTFVSCYEIEAEGRLRELAPAHFGDAKPEAAVSSPSGDTVWVFGNDDSRRGTRTVLRRYDVASDGTLTESLSLPLDLKAASGHSVVLAPRRRD